MRVHFQQLTEPITIDNDQFVELILTHSFQIPTQLKSQPPRSRRLQPSPRESTPRACGDPIRSHR